MKSLFLHGYGLSIKVQNSRLVFSQGIDPFSDRKRLYKARSGITRKDGYQKMEEITIMKMKCIELKDFCRFTV